MKNQFFHSHLNESILGETYNIAMITRVKNKCNANITGLAKQIACTAKCANTPKRTYSILPMGYDTQTKHIVVMQMNFHELQY